CEALYFTRDFPLEADIERMDVECHCCGALYFQKKLTARDLDQFTSCCHKGTVVLSPLLLFPNELKSFFLQEHPLSKTFFKNIHKYNVLLSQLDLILWKVSPFAQAFQMMKEVQHKENNTAIEQVAAIFIGSGDCDFPSHYLAVYPCSDQLKTIPVIN
ncbi:6691_t:CDS:2, partial [Cetraspora pellucida]